MAVSSAITGCFRAYDFRVYEPSTPLLGAIVNRDRKSVAVLIGTEKNLNEPIDQGATVLFAAILAGDTETVRLLLDAGADPNFVAAEPAATIYAQNPLDLALTARALMNWDVYHPIVLLLHRYGATDIDGNPERFDDLEQIERRCRERQSRAN